MGIDFNCSFEKIKLFLDGSFEDMIFVIISQSKRFFVSILGGHCPAEEVGNGLLSLNVPKKALKKAVCICKTGINVTRIF